jgi:hypothetical protein
MHEETKSSLNSGNACCQRIENLLPSHAIPENAEIKLFRTVIFYTFLCACETWCFMLRDKQRLRVFVNRLLKKIHGPKTGGMTGGREDCVMRSFIIHTTGRILLG